MEITSVDPRKIRIPAVRVTAQMDEETSRQFEASIHNIGIDEPIKCYQIDGDLWLSDGLHRLQQALALGLPQVDVIIRPGTVIDMLCNNVMSGHLRGKHPLSGMVRVIEELWKVHGLGPDEVAQKTGLTRDHVEGIMLISQLTPMIREAVDNGILNFSQALELVRIEDPVCAEAVYGQWTLARWSAKELRSHITEVLRLKKEQGQPGPAVSPPVPAPLYCFYCQRPLPVEQLKNPNTCLECAGILLGAIAQAKVESFTGKEARGE